MADKSITPAPISSFIGQEFLRSSQFILLMPANRFIADTNATKEISMFCESIEFPGINAVSTDYTMAGMNKIRIPYSKDYQDVTLTFIHNINIPMYYYMMDWVRAASGQQNLNINRNSITVPYFDEYVSSFKLLQLTDTVAPNNRFGGLSKILTNLDKINSRLLNSDNLFNTTRIGQSFVSNFNSVTTDRTPRAIYYSVEFINAYPTNVQSIASNWGDDGYQKVTATFGYEYFTVSRPFYDDYESV